MLKTRKRSISLLVTLVFLLSIMLPATAAFAAPGYVKISSSYKWVKTGENQDAGVIKVVYGADYDDTGVSGAAPIDIYTEIALPEGVKFSSVTDVTYKDWTWVGGSDTVVTVTYKDEVPNKAFADLTVGDIKLDIDSGVTGDIKANVHVWAVQEGAIVWDVSSNVTIAKVATGDVSVTAASPKTLTVGSDKAGAKITIDELSPGALTAGPWNALDNDIFLTIKATGVKWDKDAMEGLAAISTVGVEVYGVDQTVYTNFTNNDKTLRLDVMTPTTVLKGKIEITPKFIVQPGASGDVVVKVSGDDVPTTELTVGKIGVAGVAVTVKDADKEKVYLGQKATFDKVKVTLDPLTQFNEGDYITITLPAGLKWDKDAPFDISPEANLSFAGLYNSDRSAWISVDQNESADVDLTDFALKADYNAPVGDLEITFGGAVEGSYKIGSVKVPFTIVADEVKLPLRGSDLPGGKIVITEDDAGALISTTGSVYFFDIVLPMGVTWARTPKIDVVEGDLVAGDASVDGDTLKFKITASNLVSVIELTDIYFNVDNRAALGDVIAKVGKEYNEVSSNYLTSVKLGTIVSPTAVEAVLTVGSKIMTVNGKTIEMDVEPYIKNDRFYVSARFCSKAMGVDDANILWDGATKTATIIKGEKVIQLKVDSNVMLINGAAITMDTAPEIVPPGRLMLPIGWVGWALGARADWDPATKTATLTIE